MEELSFEEKARQTYRKYVEEGLQMFPPFKGFGMKLTQFAIEEPEMFRCMFMSPYEGSFQDFLKERLEGIPLYEIIQKSLHITRAEAEWIFQKMIIYSIGLGSVLSSMETVMTEEEISESYGALFRGMMLHMKNPTDERVRLMPTENAQELGSFSDYLKGKKNVIVGYGPEKEMYQIRVDAILYFEAVGENVFAYTRNNMYEIKQRLYQVEEYVKDFSFVRVSKSLLVNTRKIMEVHSEEGGRGCITMMNGETVIASRKYYRDLVNLIKMPV